jgi:predicted molibdopterin-dependent oxidoreductase YjgC
VISIKLNHQHVNVKAEQTILDVAKKQGVRIPTLCHYSRGESKDSPRAVCRVCVVEVKGVKGLQTACSTKVCDKMEIQTHSEAVVEARKVLVEFMLAENEGAKQDNKVKQLSAELEVESARFSIAKDIKEKPKALLTEYFKIDPDLCVHCDRCIVACQSRKVITRCGFGHEVSTSFGDEEGIDASDCNHCGDCVSACPVGGITKR